MSDREITARLIALCERPHALRGWLATVDHKEIGKRDIVNTGTFLLIGGVEAILMRLQVGAARFRHADTQASDQIFTMHGVTMICWYASTILSRFANYRIPLMAQGGTWHPRVNVFSYWTVLASGPFLYISPFLGQAPHGGGSRTCRIRPRFIRPG